MATECVAVATKPLVVPTILLNHVCQFNDVFALFVLLAWFKSMFIFPAQCCLAALTINICNCMESCQQYSFFCRSTAYINHRIKEVRSALTSLKRLRYKLVVIGKVCPTMNARICSVAVGQIRLKRFHHGGTAIQTDSWNFLLYFKTEATNL